MYCWRLVQASSGARCKKFRTPERAHSCGEKVLHLFEYAPCGLRKPARSLAGRTGCAVADFSLSKSKTSTDVDDYRAKLRGTIRVLVMVHGVTDIGLSRTTLTWKREVSYDVYRVDARGHGLSDPFTPVDEGDTLVKDVVEFVRVMKFEKPILMRHSMGAATVMRVGAEPDLALFR